MRSDLIKISKDLLIYSALASDFEPLDFKNDALAGVRANYFNAGNMPQAEKTELTLDSMPLSLSYSMKQGEPLSWKAIYNNQPYQTVKRESYDKYCVLSYNADGIVFKRQYFDNSHAWLRTEFFSGGNSTPAAALYPKLKDRILTLIYKTYGDVKTKRVLFPSLKSSGKKCAALVYSNAGMIWFDEAFKPSDYSEEAQTAADGFNFRLEDFTHDIYAKVNSKLDSAEYLTYDDVPKPPDVETAPVEETAEYSAYEKIESILFEAHKTNKNIFGELANESRSEKTNEPEQDKTPDDSPQPDIAQSEEEPGADSSAQAEEELSADSAAEEMVEAFGVNPDYDTTSVPADEKPKADFKPAIEEKPDFAIKTKSGEYLYYGKLDAQNRRTGRGRTVSANGLTSYEGEYENDKRQGFGICYYKEGSVNYVGNWNNGNRDGAGVGYRLSDGTMHAGGWSNNAPSGFGARFDKNGSFLDVCTYVDGKRNGKSVSFDEDGNIVVRFWSNGEMITEKIIAD
ncbi:MAG TPA: hypothetical protein DEO32_03210 [Ruminococcaceae bacterium]|nr:hypothetical protein [Oscillospiraceae bacterium]